jgi:hypothetical protein
MLKLTSLAIGLLTAIAIAPTSQAMTATGNLLTLQQPSADLHAQIIVKIGGQPEYLHRWESERRRQLDLQREREARARWEAEHRRHEYDYQRYHSREVYRPQVVESREYYDKYRGEYRRDR